MKSQLAIGLIAGTLLGFFVSYYVINQKTLPIFQEQHQTGALTDPLLDCVNPETSAIGSLNVSKFQLTDFVDNIVNSGRVDSLSVYVRDLNNGPWVGVNESEQFIGGSLLKVPILIAYLKLSESDPSVLSKAIAYKNVIADNTQYFSSGKQIEVGKTYTVKDLLDYLIKYSDNNAAELLSGNLPSESFDDVFEALGQGRPNVNEPYPVNTVTYSGFFRILFNASYLSKADSETALKMLTETTFTKGITYLLPSGITVAHKFGERGDENVDQLHDCGIVYYPNHPYLLCIMSTGKNFDSMASAIASVSKFVYDQIDTNPNV